MFGLPLVMAKTITFPVTVGKKETLGKSVPSTIEFGDRFIVLTLKYKYTRPKDVDDEFSEVVDTLCDYQSTILRSSITSLWYIWDTLDGCYSIEITSSGTAFSFNLADREQCLSVYEQIRAWWLA